MFVSQKVVWAEGVFLGQQHFQQWEKSLHEHQKFLHHYQFNKTYGVCHLSVNQGKLCHREVQIEALTALMPDGRWVHYVNENEDNALTLTLTEGIVSVYLALPKSEVVKGISGYPETDLDKTAWQADYQPCFDLYDKSKEVEMLYAKQQCFLTADRHYEDSCCLMKIAEFHSTQSTANHLPSFIPPLLTLEGSSVLQSIIMSVRAEISTVISALKAGFKTKPSTAIRDKNSLSYSLILLTTLAKYGARLLAFENKTNTSIKALYGCFNELISELSVCAGEVLPEFLPYNPETLAPLFNTLARQIKTLLEEISPQDNKAILLTEISNNLYVSDPFIDRFTPNDFLYLEVCEYHENEGWALRFERGVKLGSASKIKDIYDSAIAGVKLKYTKRPPSAISIKPNCEYFQVLCEGPYWEQVLEEGQLGILKSQEFSSVSLHLIIINA